MGQRDMSSFLLFYYIIPQSVVAFRGLLPLGTWSRSVDGKKIVDVGLGDVGQRDMSSFLLLHQIIPQTVLAFRGPYLDVGMLH